MRIHSDSQLEKFFERPLEKYFLELVKKNIFQTDIFFYPTPLENTPARQNRSAHIAPRRWGCSSTADTPCAPYTPRLLAQSSFPQARRACPEKTFAVTCQTSRDRRTGGSFRARSNRAQLR